MQPTDKQPLIGGHTPAPAPVFLQQAVEDLRRSLDGVVAQAEALRKEVESSDKRRTKENAYVIAVGAALILPILLLLAIAWQGTRVARNAQDAAREAKATSDRIASCTTPAGQCYRDSSKRTSGAVQNLIKAQLAIAECARRTGTDAALEACVTARLAKP